MTGVAEKIFKEIVSTYFDRPIMSNLARPMFVEHMIAGALKSDFKLVSGEWSGWDMETLDGSFRLEIKQSAACQVWTGRLRKNGSHLPPGDGQFDIAPRKAYFTDSGAKHVVKTGRYADAYILAWHGETDRDKADQRRPQDWLFYVVPTSQLPVGQKKIKRKSVETNLGVAPCKIMKLSAAVEALVVSPPPPVTDYKALSEALRLHYEALYNEYVQQSKRFGKTTKAFPEWYERTRRDDERIEKA